MKKSIIAFVVMFLAVPATALASAVLIDSQGSVTVTIAGQTQPGKVGLELPDGSRVSVKEGSAQVLLESGTMDEIGSGKSYTVGEKPAGKRTDMGSGITLAMRELATSGEGPTVHGMVKKVGGPVNVQGAMMRDSSGGFHATSPRSTSIVLGEMITFSWNQPPPFKNAIVVIDDAKRRRLAVAGIEGEATSFTRTTNKLHLKPGESYSWFLAERKGDGVKAKTARYSFKTLSIRDANVLGGELARIRAMKMSADGKDLLAAQVYFEAGMLSDMVETLKPLYERTKSPFAKKLLVLGYQKMGLSGEAAKYR